MSEVEEIGRTFPGGAPDQEVHDLMHKLSDLQTWCVMMGQKDSGGTHAARLIQDTRCLIVERLYPGAIKAKTHLQAIQEDQPDVH